MTYPEIERFILQEIYHLKFAGVKRGRWRSLISARFVNVFYKSGKASSVEFLETWDRLERLGLLKK